MIALLGLAGFAQAETITIHTTSGVGYLHQYHTNQAWLKPSLSARCASFRESAEVAIAMPNCTSPLPYFPFSRTSSSGAAHGYGSISISPGSATRGPIPLTQMNS